MSPIENQIIIKSFKHYRVRVAPGAPDFVEVHEFPEDCPSMGDREPFTEADGVLLARYPKDTSVVFIQVLGKGTLGELAQALDPEDEQVLDPEILCGDDFCGELRRRPGSRAQTRLDSVGGSVTKASNEVP